MIHPHILNLRLKRIKNIIKQDEHDRAIEEIDTIIRDEFDTLYFSNDAVDIIVDKLELAMISLLMSTPIFAIVNLNIVRTVLDKIFIKNLLLVNRLFKEGSDIGTLAKLPDLVKFELHKEIYLSM